MDVKAAVIMAKDHVADVFLGEDIRNVGLEEVEFDDSLGRWIVTIGFLPAMGHEKRSQCSPRGEPSRPLI